MLAREHLVLVAPADAKPLHANISLTAIAGYPLILPSLPNAVRHVLDEVLQPQGVTLNVTTEVGAVATMLAMVAGGRGLYDPARKRAAPGRPHGRPAPVVGAHRAAEDTEPDDAGRRQGPVHDAPCPRHGFDPAELDRGEARGRVAGRSRGRRSTPEIPFNGVPPGHSMAPPRPVPRRAVRLVNWSERRSGDFRSTQPQEATHEPATAPSRQCERG
ncbi:hypothetical protein CAL15_13010 [Bordetella genomosp. 13]|uniref:LysR substrate-binding domain-containing protein n=1 Tax=Bordetella genomosp. 13 TaxID=463040 RepID=A0A1W6ZCW0_9BORD|nr:hypothetical protein CAL15_13010 [Bordetella genomosp. 13]